MTASATNSAGQTITSLPSSSFTPVAAGLPSQLVFTTQPVAGVSAAVLTTQPVIAVEDAGGNVVATSSLGITLTSSGGTLASCTGLSAVAGVINVGNCTFAGVVGANYSLIATPTSGSIPPKTSASFSPTGPGPSLGHRFDRDRRSHFSYRQRCRRFDGDSDAGGFLHQHHCGKDRFTERR